MVFTPLSAPLATAIAHLSSEDHAKIVGHIGPIALCDGNDEGTSVLAFRLNHEWVLRLARTKAAPLARETRLLRAIGSSLPTEMRNLLPIPDVAGECWTLHRHLPGLPTSRADLQALPASQRGRLLAEMGNLLHTLHTLPLPADLPAADTPHTPDQWNALRQRAETQLFPLLSGKLADDLRGALSALDTASLRPARTGFIHDDLHPAHILHDPASGRLTGLLDFGRSGRGDPAVDIAGFLYNWGNGPLTELAYPGLADHLPQARALARTYEVQWALEGIKRQDMRWLLYALGAAKDF